ncbi:protein-ADP-ribose hydrolase [Adlercreutzia agrestimuris]|uniref:protein-ADP-ribose hydrolase n=1 Tax=Adlercreutzia agrestimuris TaxID=2941324 RepID=UPI002041E47D|nr:protein-ADP-ribose hydrolase [Adlercreutzia agrestimuris]
MDAQRKESLARTMLGCLIEESRAHGVWVPDSIVDVLDKRDASFQNLWDATRAMMNVRPPWKASPQFLIAQDELLPDLIAEAGICTVADAEPCEGDARMSLWRGDITTLAADAIVNAANSGMTGCWQPLHYCIDNAIHTFAGVQLRAEMASIMEAQGHEEPTAHARITGAYNLPSKHIIHTVGPIAKGRLTEERRRQLARCYTACLDTANAHDCLSIALCCISTGVFGFPRKEAAEIAVRTVREWLADHSDSPMVVVFNVFGDEDEAIYRDLLQLDQKGASHVQIR